MKQRTTRSLILLLVSVACRLPVGMAVRLTIRRQCPGGELTVLTFSSSGGRRLSGDDSFRFATDPSPSNFGWDPAGGSAPQIIDLNYLSQTRPRLTLAESVSDDRSYRLPPTLTAGALVLVVFFSVVAAGAAFALVCNFSRVYARV